MTQKTSLNYEQGQLAVADVLFSNQVGIKRRPVLVISRAEFNEHADDLILLRISSSPARARFDVNLSNEDVIGGELKTTSSIMVDFPATLQKDLVVKIVGKISEQKLAEVKQKMRELYGL
ncbi:MAG: type II toxin-antitoxin system PemK/MazF family toxin [Candidatus Diapherotrites archaeon]|uniref:Type II toxin-antitoxin system PemK/MazF family toxin n=1 Tax=Candidatus Iainarchaeum sp. TaxID=3101447 RepID=A0A8T4LH97_9ARCH|nr:type II toxin-antitoxin system PemK/MazF family toxin [Candidatus Diapherotrites archaeon]